MIKLLSIRQAINESPPPPLPSPPSVAFSRRCRAEELDADIKTIKGVDEAAALRELEDGLRKLKAAFKEVKGLAQGAQEAADKCQVCALFVVVVVSGSGGGAVGVVVVVVVGGGGGGAVGVGFGVVGVVGAIGVIGVGVGDG